MINSCSIIIPTRNAGLMLPACLDSIKMQITENVRCHTLIIDSASTDDTINIANSYDVRSVKIEASEFNHGGTRNKAISMAGDVDIVILMTQDAVLDSKYSVMNILKCFSDPLVGAVCGRQLPHVDANPLAIHARAFNYPKKSCVKSLADVKELGIKAAFMSNSFSAYRRDLFNELGGFPENTILSEDMYMAAKIILAGHKVGYSAESTVRHSHNYSPIQELMRYFDIGVFHACEPWIQEAFGGASGEGIKFVKSELLYLLKNSPSWIFKSLISIACKFIGYRLGNNYKIIPISWRLKLSMHKNYWLQSKHNY